MRITTKNGYRMALLRFVGGATDNKALLIEDYIRAQAILKSIKRMERVFQILEIRKEVRQC